MFKIKQVNLFEIRKNMEIVKQQDLKTIRNRSQYIKYDGTEYVHDQFNTYT